MNEQKFNIAYIIKKSSLSYRERDLIFVKASLFTVKEKDIIDLSKMFFKKSEKRMKNQRKNEKPPVVGYVLILEDSDGIEGMVVVGELEYNKISEGDMYGPCFIFKHIRKDFYIISPNKDNEEAIKEIVSESRMNLALLVFAIIGSFLFAIIIVIVGLLLGSR